MNAEELAAIHVAWIETLAADHAEGSERIGYSYAYGSMSAQYKATLKSLEAACKMAKERDEARVLADRLAAELAECAAVLPGAYYMDPPDGGDVSVSEQLSRMAKDAERYRLLRRKFAIISDGEGHAEFYEALDTLSAVIGLTPVAGNKEALQEAYDNARAALAKARGESLTQERGEE